MFSSVKIGKVWKGKKFKKEVFWDVLRCPLSMIFAWDQRICMRNFLLQARCLIVLTSIGKYSKFTCIQTHRNNQIPPFSILWTTNTTQQVFWDVLRCPLICNLFLNLLGWFSSFQYSSVTFLSKWNWSGNWNRTPLSCLACFRCCTFS